ncbi:ABC transporter substrate-binding protein [Ktedonobacter sp. SOSP1-52]|uniref:extracellular solute-binding protein n=1 Tax=Ktedonobacter sp. SOSP1-52 TaxID=2778366 RepID=UPI001915E236|nr:extracellular solute-binding protein [Ktedonobacter sp. SOSP1-52]GHO65191.1 ABC transporter substrate-binding protein [Ktedonobacter sp. SOSP1-52]
MKRRDFLASSIGAAGAALSIPSLLAACGSSSPSSSGGPVTINWWHIITGDPGKSFLQGLANQYTKAHPNVKFKITVLENDAFKQKLTTVMQSGSPPDLFTTWGGGVLLQYAKAGLVQDLSSYLQGSWGSTFDTSALNIYGDNGKYYAVPTDNGAVGFWYNKALFSKAGITTPPATWTDFLQTIKKLQSAGITPIGLGAKDKWPAMYYWTYLGVRLGGKAAFDKAYNRTGGGSFADPPFVQAGVRLQELVALNPFQKGYLGASYTDQQTVMGNGKAAMELMGQWAPGNDKGVATDKKGPDFGLFPFPMVEGGAGNPTDVMGGGGGYAVGKNAPLAEAADFLKFMTNATNAATMVAQNISVPPIKTAEAAVTDPLRKEVDAMAAAAPYFQLYYDQFLPPAVGQVLLDQVQGLFAGSVTPQAAAKAIDDSVAASLNQ